MKNLNDFPNLPLEKSRLTTSLLGASRDFHAREFKNWRIPDLTRDKKNYHRRVEKLPGANKSLQRGINSLLLRTKDWVLQHFGDCPVGKKEGLHDEAAIDTMESAQQGEVSLLNPINGRPLPLEACSFGFQFSSDGSCSLDNNATTGG